MNVHLINAYPFLTNSSGLLISARTTKDFPSNPVKDFKYYSASLNFIASSPFYSIIVFNSVRRLLIACPLSNNSSPSASACITTARFLVRQSRRQQG